MFCKTGEQRPNPAAAAGAGVVLAVKDEVVVSCSLLGLSMKNAIKALLQTTITKCSVSPTTFIVFKCACFHFFF